MRLRAKGDPIIGFGFFDHLVAQGRTVFLEAGKTDILMIALDSQPVAGIGRFENLHCGLGNFGPDAIARQDEETHSSFPFCRIANRCGSGWSG